ncbi:CPBP family intramembrane glutamic endopeptidase [Streptococcus equi]|uniref:CPBP family intramembrane glutamic endopeptidase n=1 Tax=Streptococcus equi TaxID=1336 RepID=UPI0013F5FDE6|nr:type II CAAX endopeptidase family protein [Streptococcus equi]
MQYLFPKWENKKRPLEAIILFIGFYLLNFSLIRLVPEFAFIKQIQIPYFSDILITLIDVVSLGSLLVIMNKRQLTLSNTKFKIGIKRLVVTVLISFLLISLTDIVFNSLFPMPPLAKLPVNERIVSFFIEFIIAVISGPIFEEVLFRGLLLKYVFTNRPIIGLFASTILFVLAHTPTDWTAYIYHGIPAIILGIAYLYTEHFSVPVGVHMAINFVSHIKIKFF